MIMHAYTVVNACLKHLINFVRCGGNDFVFSRGGKKKKHKGRRGEERVAAVLGPAGDADPRREYLPASGAPQDARYADMAPK